MPTEPQRRDAVPGWMMIGVYFIGVAAGSFATAITLGGCN